MLDREAVFPASPVATLLALLLELLLGLGVGEAEEQLDIVTFVEDGMELSDDTFGDLAGFESAKDQQ